MTRKQLMAFDQFGYTAKWGSIQIHGKIHIGPNGTLHLLHNIPGPGIAIDTPFRNKTGFDRSCIVYGDGDIVKQIEILPIIY